MSPQHPAPVGPPALAGAVLVVVPTYNEVASLSTVAGRLRQAVPDAHLLVVDDASPDGTGELAAALAATDDHVHVLHRAAKEGLGAAYAAGFSWGLARGASVLVEMDADGSHQPEELPRLLAALEHADLVLGSRWVPGGQVRRWPAVRSALSRGGNAYVRALLGVPLADATGGFRAFRADCLRGMGLSDVVSAGYCFQVDLAWRAVRGGYRVVEVPITFVEREHGTSKMSAGIVAEALWRVTGWGVAHRAGRLRRLVPGPARWSPKAGRPREDDGALPQSGAPSPPEKR